MAKLFFYRKIFKKYLLRIVFYKMFYLLSLSYIDIDFVFVLLIKTQCLNQHALTA